MILKIRRNIFSLFLLVFLTISILPVMADLNFSMGTNLDWGLPGNTIDIGIVSATGFSGHYLFSREISFFFDTAFMVEYTPVSNSISSTFNGNLQVSYRKNTFFSSLNTSLLLDYDTSGEYSNVKTDIRLPLSIEQVNSALTIIPSMEMQWNPELTSKVAEETILTFLLFDQLLLKPKLKLEYLYSSQYNSFNTIPAISISWYPSIHYTLKFDSDCYIPSNTTAYGYKAKLSTDLHSILNLGMASLLDLGIEFNFTPLSNNLSTSVIDLFPSLSLDVNLTEKISLNASSYIILNSINIAADSNTSIRLSINISCSL